MLVVKQNYGKLINLKCPAVIDVCVCVCVLNYICIRINKHTHTHRETHTLKCTQTIKAPHEHTHKWSLFASSNNPETHIYIWFFLRPNPRLLDQYTWSWMDQAVSHSDCDTSGSNCDLLWTVRRHVTNQHSLLCPAWNRRRPDQWLKEGRGFRSVAERRNGDLDQWPKEGKGFRSVAERKKGI